MKIWMMKPKRNYMKLQRVNDNHLPKKKKISVAA